jgi:hypothetical protein
MARRHRNVLSARLTSRSVRVMTLLPEYAHYLLRAPAFAKEPERWPSWVLPEFEDRCLAEPTLRPTDGVSAQSLLLARG